MVRGLPDYMGEIHRSKNIWGYIPDIDEEFLFALLIATPSPGAYAFTRGSIASEETVELIDAFTGLDGITMPAGWDFLIKEIWISFNQPMFFQMYQDQVSDTGCDGYIPPFGTPYVIGLPIGWTRAQIEETDVESITYIRVKNLSAQVAYGKCWVVGFKKLGLYEWY